MIVVGIFMMLGELRNLNKEKLYVGRVEII